MSNFSKNKCSHGIEHKEVLGTALCVCCLHCQKENEGLKKELEEQARLLGAGGSRELALQARIQEMEKEWGKDRQRLVDAKKEIESLRETVRLQSLERWEWSEKKTKLIREGADAEIRVLNKEIEDLRRK